MTQAPGSRGTASPSGFSSTPKRTERTPALTPDLKKKPPPSPGSTAMFSPGALPLPSPLEAIQHVVTAKPTLATMCSCRCFDSCQCSHDGRISSFFTKDLDMRGLKAGTCTPHDFSPSAAASPSTPLPPTSPQSPSHPTPLEIHPRASSPSAALNSMNPSSILTKVINDTETLLNSFEPRIKNNLTDDLMSPLTDPAPISAAGSGKSAIVSQRRVSLANTSMTASPPVGMFQSRFFKDAPPPLGNYFPATPNPNPNSSRPSTAPTYGALASSSSKMVSYMLNDPVHMRGNPPNFRLKKSVNITQEVNDANTDLLMGELVSQSYRLVHKVLPWQAQMCPRAFEDLEAARSKYFFQIANSMLIGYRHKEQDLQKAKFKKEKESMQLFLFEEAERVSKAESYEKATASLIQNEETGRVLANEAGEKKLRAVRRSAHLHEIDAIEQTILNNSLEFEFSMRSDPSNNPLLSKRGLLTMNQTVQRNNAIENVSRLSKSSNSREDAYFWLLSAGEAAMVKQFVELEESRVRKHVEAQANLAASLGDDEMSRIKSSLLSEYHRLLKNYQEQKSSLATLHKVDQALANGASETIARLLRSFLKSNDDPSDRVKLFWEIKNSVDRFTHRRKASKHKHTEAAIKFQTYKKKCVQNLTRFKKKEITHMARAIAKEKVRVEALTKANAAAFTSSQIEEAKRVERNYATTINEILNVRYRANARFDLYVSNTLAANQEEFSTSTKLYSATVEHFKALNTAKNEFQNTMYSKLIEQDRSLADLYNSIDSKIKKTVSTLEMQLFAVVMSQKNLVEVQQELTHEHLFKGFVDHLETQVFPLPISQDIASLTSQIQEAAMAPRPTSLATAAAAATPPVWELFPDPDSGHNYYYNATSCESVWEVDATEDIIASASGASKEVALNPPPSPRPKFPQLSQEFNAMAEKTVSLADSFFNSRISDIHHEAETFKNTFDEEMRAQEISTSKIQEEATREIREAHGQVERVLREFGKAQKDSIAEFSVSQISSIGTSSDNALLNESASFWNKRELDLKLLTTELLNLTSSPEFVEISSALLSNVQTETALVQKQNALPAPSASTSLTAATLASSITSLFLPSPLPSSDTHTLEEIIKVVSSADSTIPAHVLSACLTASIETTASSSNPGASNSMPSFSLAAFAAKFGEISAASSLVAEAIKAATSSDPSNEFVMPEKLKELRKLCEKEALSLASIAASTIECSLPDDAISSASLYQILRYSAPSAFLSAGDASMIISSCYDSGAQSLSVTKSASLLTKIYSEALSGAASVAFVSSGQFVSPTHHYESHSFPLHRSPSPYLSNHLKTIFLSDYTVSNKSPNLSIDRVSYLLQTSPILTLPKATSISIIAEVAKVTHRVSSPSKIASPAFQMDVSDSNIIDAVTSAVCKLLSPAFLHHAPQLSGLKCDEVCKAIEKNFSSSLDEFLSEYEGQGDTPLREKNVHHARRIMDANILLDMVAQAEDWHVDKLYECYDAASGTPPLSKPSDIKPLFDLYKSLPNHHAVALLCLGNFLHNPNPHEIRLVEQNSRHLAGVHQGVKPCYVEFRSLSHSAPFAATAILRRHNAALSLYQTHFERSLVPKELNEAYITAARLNREHYRMSRLRDIADDETFQAVNAIRVALLKICNEFEQERIRNFIKDKTLLRSRVEQTDTALEETISQQKEKLIKFERVMLDNLQLQSKTEVQLMKDFRESCEKAVVSFNGKLRDLLETTEKLADSSVTSFRSLNDSVLNDFEKEAFGRLLEAYAEEIQESVTASIAEVGEQCKTNKAEFAVKEQSYEEVSGDEMSNVKSECQKLQANICIDCRCHFKELSKSVTANLASVMEGIDTLTAKTNDILATTEKAALELGAVEANELATAKTPVKGSLAGGIGLESMLATNANIETTDTIMSKAKEGFEKMLAPSQEKLSELEGGLSALESTLKEKFNTTVANWKEEVNSLKVREVAKIDNLNAEIARAAVAFAKMQENFIEEGRDKEMKRIRELFVENGKEISEVEENIIKSLSAKVDENSEEEKTVLKGQAEDIQAWISSAKKDAAADSEAIFEKTLASSEVTSDEELKFLVLCHDTVTKMADRRLELLSEQLTDQVGEQAASQEKMDDQLLGTLVKESHQRTLPKILNSMIQTVEVMVEAEGTFGNMLTVNKVQDDGIMEKEEQSRGKMQGSLNACFEQIWKDLERDEKVLAVEMQGVLSSCLGDFQKCTDMIVKLEADFGGSINDMAAKVKENRDKLVKEAQETKRKERERLEKEEKERLEGERLEKARAMRPKLIAEVSSVYVVEVLNGAVESLVDRVVREEAEKEKVRAAQAQRGRTHTVAHSQATGLVVEQSEEEKAEEDKAEEEEKIRAAQAQRGRTHTVAHSQAAGLVVEQSEEGKAEEEGEKDSLISGLAGGSLVGGSLAEGSLDDGSLVTEVTSDLHEMDIEGTMYLVEIGSGKVYTSNDEQNYVGKLKPSGGIDLEAVDSSEEEDEDEDDSLFASAVHNPTPGAANPTIPATATVQGSMLDDGSTFTEDSGDLHEMTIQGKKYLVEVSSGKVYLCNEDQDFVGKLKPNGVIDHDAIDSSDEEDDEGTREPSITTLQSNRTEPSLVREEKKGEDGDGSGDGGSSSDDVELHEILYKGRKVLLDKSSKKVYEADEDQKFLGKMLVSGEVDFDAVDSSDDEEEGVGWQ
ncbi:hypothetical protein TrCOL_g12443 [Triparma columacea]|uniref:WW domain-containing protein n=1 Tax=Triparma columacea TaxID=722753 RepID=A0A9W7L8V6_9STRA|nr:hypothetical protein TrCOL_g12443 [Triparma columacea]